MTLPASLNANPAAGMDKCKVPRRIYETLRAEEVPLLIAHLDEKWRGLFLCAVWTGMRKADLDLAAGTIAIQRSHDADTTKGGNADVIPIAGPLRPHLERAVLESCPELVLGMSRRRLKFSEAASM